MTRSPDRRHDRRIFYKYMKAKTANTVLATRTLRWSSPVLFNDPFDVTQDLRLNFDGGKFTAVLNERLAAVLEQGDLSTLKHPMFAALSRLLVQMTPERRRIMARALRERLDPPTAGQVRAIAALKEQWKELVPTFRILCLSELHDVPPMWQHYADGYRGVVLEFAAVEEVDSAFLVARPVIYQDEAPAIADPEVWADRMLSHRGYAELFTEYQYVKTTSWSYEREWRIASTSRPGDDEFFGDYGFHPRELTAMYLGQNCSKEDRLDLMALLVHGLEHVRTFEVFPDTQRGRIGCREIER